jgi:hypothetical protein
MSKCAVSLDRPFLAVILGFEYASSARRLLMVARGHVENGVVVLDEGVRLPEGLEVTIIGHGSTVSQRPGRESHRILDIPPVSLGAVLRPLTSEADLLGEMLEGRP